jgi:hypothetical protein
MLPQPPESFRFTQLLPTLLFDAALPIIAFNVLTAEGVSTLWALAAGAMFPALNNARSLVKSRRIEPVGAIVITFLVLGTGASLISGNVFFALIKESFLTATFGGVCLGSLLAERPLFFFLMRQFVAGDDPVRLQWWNGLWQYPEVRFAQRFVTGVWGIVYLLEACFRVAFAVYLTPAEVVAISPVMAFGALIALIAWTRRYMLATRERRMYELQAGLAAAVAQ